MLVQPKISDASMLVRNIDAAPNHFVPDAVQTVCAKRLIP
jgi:hypothetical protein